MNIRSISATVASETVSPLLWCVGRSRLVWPNTLTDEDAINRSRGIITHELAHVRRRDHWVAWLFLAEISPSRLALHP
jgi:beta-lactamase regulating signal transducer with metallopeptidase domain